MFRIEVSDLKDLPKAAKIFVEKMGENTIFPFYGEMGAGKTTFITAICEALGVNDVVTSPTFALINEYPIKKDKKIYHFDFYRIKSIEEAFDLGYEEYFYSGNICFIEWPEKIESLIPGGAMSVKINVLDDGKREILLG